MNNESVLIKFVRKEGDVMLLEKNKSNKTKLKKDLNILRELIIDYPDYENRVYDEEIICDYLSIYQTILKYQFTHFNFYSNSTWSDSSIHMELFPGRLRVPNLRLKSHLFNNLSN